MRHIKIQGLLLLCIVLFASGFTVGEDKPISIKAMINNFVLAQTRMNTPPAPSIVDAIIANRLGDYPNTSSFIDSPVEPSLVDSLVEQALIDFPVEPVLIKEAEVLAAIRFTLESKKDLSEDAKQVLIQSSKGKSLPARTLLTIIGRYDHGGQFVYDVQNIRLSIPISTYKQITILVRKSHIRSCTLEDELLRLEMDLAKSQPGPGLYRLKDRVNELKSRINKVK